MAGSGDAKGFDRREFLKGSAAAIVVAGVAPWLVAGTTSPGATTPGKAGFQALVNQWFHVGGDPWESVQLVAVTDGPAAAGTEQFTLLFRGASGEVLAEGTYTVAPPTGDAFPLFLQPVDDGSGDAAYRASFSLLAPKPVAPSCAAPA